MATVGFRVILHLRSAVGLAHYSGMSDRVAGQAVPDMQTISRLLKKRVQRDEPPEPVLREAEGAGVEGSDPCSQNT